MNPTQDFIYTAQMTSPTINLLLPTIHGPLSQDSLGQNNNTHNYKMQDTIGPQNSDLVNNKK